MSYNNGHGLQDISLANQKSLSQTLSKSIIENQQTNNVRLKQKAVAMLLEV